MVLLLCICLKLHQPKLVKFYACTPTSEDRLTFCEIHQAETTIVPDGIQKELLDIINGKANSYYRDFALKICNEVGSREASTSMALMARFEVLKGYYGQRGLNIISDVLSKLLLDTNLLTYNLVFPKKPVDYLQEVLVPETTLHLISQDKGGLEFELA
ncbi:hypothetical protein C2G38_2036567 [Gigaspora rosea]|uniref:Restriction of telomere capping protein 4 n=1 Tax=Gigaspora rosea TaxID=44941 RepID=A0A397VA51_9GLOM|nr:hypothetical protein C2G38_2036567 [Gigaspora rosea]